MKRPPNDLTRDEWEDFRTAADHLDKVLEEIYVGKRVFDVSTYIGIKNALETIQSTVNIVIGQPGE